MHQLLGQPIYFSAFFYAGGVAGGGPGTGLVPTPTVHVFRDNVEVAALASVEMSNGMYGVVVPGTYTSVAGTYSAVFIYGPTDNDVMSPAVWSVGTPWVQSVFEKTALIAGTAASAPPTVAAFGDELTAETAVRWTKTIILSGQASIGWQAFTFTIKADVDAEDDDAALITIRVSNPGAAADGILRWRGEAVALGAPMQTAGAIAVVTTTPDTTLTVVIVAGAMDLPPSPEGKAYTYEINRWTGGDKEQIGKGEFVLGRSVRRTTNIP